MQTTTVDRKLEGVGLKFTCTVAKTAQPVCWFSDCKTGNPELVYR